MTEAINYIFKRSWRARWVRLSVRVDGQVVVTAPRQVNLKWVEKWVRSKADWIRQKVEFFRVEGRGLVAGGNRKEFHQYRHQAKRLVMEKIRELNQQYGFSYGRVSIRCPRTRWGSCSKKGNLNFNYRLVFLPDHLADYLVTHELCHLKEMNHSSRFWDLVGLSVPEPRQCAKELRQMR